MGPSSVVDCNPDAVEEGPDVVGEGHIAAEAVLAVDHSSNHPGGRAVHGEVEAGDIRPGVANNLEADQVGLRILSVERALG